jgi:hypothetical protein
MATHPSDDEESSDEEYGNIGLDADLASIGNSTLKYLNYTKNYVRNWGIDEAFRETYQNW